MIAGICLSEGHCSTSWANGLTSYCKLAISVVIRKKTTTTNDKKNGLEDTKS